MTRTNPTIPDTTSKQGAARPVSPVQAGRWRLQDAKARFSELVRQAHQEGPQHVTVHGREAVVVVDATEFHRLTGDSTGQVLIDALQASPHQAIEIEPLRQRMPVRDVGDSERTRVRLVNPWRDDA